MGVWMLNKQTITMIGVWLLTMSVGIMLVFQYNNRLNERIEKASIQHRMFHDKCDKYNITLTDCFNMHDMANVEYIERER